MICLQQLIILFGQRNHDIDGEPITHLGPGKKMIDERQN